MDVIAADIAFGESVRWHDGRVWFCDWIDGDVRSVRPDGRDRRIEAHVDGIPVCIDWDRDGNLLVVNGGTGELLRSTGQHTELVAELSPVSAHPWNEVAAHPSGRIYVNGIGFDMMGGAPPGPGHIVVVERSGEVRLVADDLAFPNGMVVSRDGATLMVAESHAGRITAYTIEESGALGDRRVFAAVEGSAPDGLGLAADGAVWYADVPNRHCRRVREGGDVIETVEVDRGCFSCATSPAGDLYIAATVWDDDTFSTRRGVVYRLAR